MILQFVFGDNKTYEDLVFKSSPANSSGKKQIRDTWLDSLLSLTMLHQEFLPPAELQDTIKCFWYNLRDEADDQPAFEVQPDGYAEIIFHFGSTLSVARDGNLQPLPSPFIMGLLNQPVNFYANGRLEILAIRCFPWTVFDLLGLEPGKGSVRIFEHPIAKLQPVFSKCIQSGKIDEALAIAERYILNARINIANNTMLFKAGVAMRKSNGAIPVSRVAEAAHVTARTLERNFKQSAGHTVKDVSALIRFEQVRNRLWHQPGINLPGLAHELGYTDQSHLNREFKRYSGTTPAAFARKAKKGQSVINDFVAFIQS